MVGWKATEHTNPSAHWQRVAGPRLVAAVCRIEVTAQRDFRGRESLDYGYSRAAAWAGVAARWLHASGTTDFRNMGWLASRVGVFHPTFVPTIAGCPAPAVRQFADQLRLMQPLISPQAKSESGSGL